MLKAKNKTTNEYVISWKEYEKIRKDRDNYCCPSCKEEVIFVDGTLVIKHFRHKSESNCNFEPETAEHLEMKQFCQDIFNVPNEDVEYSKLDFGIPDLFLKERKVAIEVQHSEMPLSKFIERTKNYTDNGIYVLWIFHKDLIKEAPSAMLKKAHEIYFGRIYVYSEKSICPLHLDTKWNWVEPNDFSYHSGYWKPYKKKKNLVYGSQIDEYSLLTVKSEWKESYLIARFYDRKFWGKSEKPIDKNITYGNIEDAKINYQMDRCDCGNWKKEEYDVCYECWESGR